MNCNCGVVKKFAPVELGNNGEAHHVVHDKVECHTKDRCTPDLHCPFYQDIRTQAQEHLIKFQPDGCGIKECDVCASVGRNKTVGMKYDKDKDRWDLIPFAGLEQVVKVLTHGAKKYAPENWRHVDGWRWRYLGASLRHFQAFARGEKVDQESGLPHLAHAACCLLFMLELDQ